MLFKFKDHEIRVNQDGKAWFCAIDVCNALEYSNTRDAIIRHCNPKGVVKHDTLTSQGLQTLTYIDESNLYRLTLKAKTKSAVEFQDWVVDDVLPQIRNTGQYSPAVKTYSIEELIIAQAQSMIESKKKIAEIESKVDHVQAQLIELDARSITSPMDFFTVAGYGSFIGCKVDRLLGAKLGKKASAVCKDLGYTTGIIPDPRFGTVKTYHKDVLEAIFNEYKKNL